MTRGDKGRRAFVTRINFYLHCTGTPVSMYWSFLVGKTCTMLWRTAAPQVPVWAEQKGQKSHSELQEREQMVQTFTHKFTLFHDTRLLPCLSSEGLWLELVILDSALKLPGKGLQQVRSWGGVGWMNHSWGSQTTLKFSAHKLSTPVLLSSWLSTSMHISRAPTDLMVLPVGSSMAPHTHKQQPSTLWCFI